MYVYMYIYIYRERDNQISIYVYMYIYISNVTLTTMYLTRYANDRYHCPKRPRQLVTARSIGSGCSPRSVF